MPCPGIMALRGTSARPMLLARRGWCSSATEPAAAAAGFKPFWTDEDDPTKHGLSHLGRLYKIPSSVIDQMPKDSATHSDLFPVLYMDRCRAIREHAILIRRHNLEIINCLNQMDWAKRNHKIILHGKQGHGKSISLAHLYHYFLMTDAIVLNYGSIRRLLHRHLEVVESTFKPGRYDLIGSSVLLLKSFLAYNKDKLANLTVQGNYTWSEREKTVHGDPLLDIVNIGIERPKFSADAINCLLCELKQACKENKAKLAIVVDGINPIFGENTTIDKEFLSKFTSKYVTRERLARMCRPDEISNIIGLKEILKNDSVNVCVVCSVDETHTFKKRTTTRRPWEAREKVMVPDTESDKPFALLGQEGWETMDPFLPIEVPKYSREELDTFIDYLVDRRYIHPRCASSQGRKEIHFITGRSPVDFMEYSSMW